MLRLRHLAFVVLAIGVSIAHHAMADPVRHGGIAWFDPPAYKQEWRDAGLVGTVAIVTTIANDGSAQDIRVVSDPSVFDSEVVDAIHRWLFQPSICLSGKPYEARFDVVFEREGSRYFVAIRNAHYAVAQSSLSSSRGLKRIAGDDPHFPPGLFAKGVTFALVIARFRVRTDGTTEAIQLFSAPTKLFDDEVRQAVEKWRFEPYGVTGDPKPYIGCVDITFDANRH